MYRMNMWLMRNWQIISRLGFNLDFQRAVTPEEALRKYAEKQGFETYQKMCSHLRISHKWWAIKETSKIILD